MTIDSVLHQNLDQATPAEILNLAFSNYDNIAISFSGAEDVILIDMAYKVLRKVGKTLSVFTLDTGRLHAESYEYLETVRNHYDISLEILSPNHQQLQKMVSEKGLFSFYKDGHSQCCNIRKVEPLKQKLSTLDAWISGQRKDQSPDTRNSLNIIEKDMVFGTEEKPLIKFNPLANWTSQQVWEYIQMFDVPFNPLHLKGFTSIGCQPCTRAILPNQHEREGRWWWENSQAKECGLHQGNIIAKSESASV